MCKHRYRDFESLEEDKQFCSYSSFIELPVDPDGLCVFHSMDIQWKKEQDFVKWLTKLKMAMIEKKAYIKFKDFHFIARKGKHQIDYFELLTETEIENCIFHQMISAKNMCISGDLSFTHCTFTSPLHFSDCHFEGTVTFMHTAVSEDTEIPIMIFQKCTFDETFHYVHNPAVNMDFSFRACTFDAVEFVDFSNKNTLGQFEFVECKVQVFDMRNCIIESPDFKGTTFYSADIENVSFRGETIFNDIKVKSHLNFIGGENHKIFDGVTHFAIDFSNLEGQIYFENANLSTFLKSHKEALLEFEKRENGKIGIGSGCIKYRILSDDMVYRLKDFHQHLIREIGHSFASFFTQYNGFNLGIEVRNKTKHDITLFYFTDDDIDKALFIQMLGDTSARVFGVVPENIDETSSRQDALVNFQIDLIRSLTKISYQIQKQNWGISDSKTFFNALNLNPNIHLDEKSTHAFLEKIDVNDFLKAVQELNINVNQNGDKNTFIGFLDSGKIEIRKENHK